MQELNNTWESKREYNAQPVRKQHEKIDLSVLKKEERYTDLYNEGEVQPLDAYFLTEHGFNVQDWGATEEKYLFAEQDRRMD